MLLLVVFSATQGSCFPTVNVDPVAVVVVVVVVFFFSDWRSISVLAE